MPQPEKPKDETWQERFWLEEIPFSCHLWTSDLKLFACNEETVKLFQLNNKQEFIDGFANFSPDRQPDGSLLTEAILKCMKEVEEKGQAVTDWVHKKADGTLFPAKVILVKIMRGDSYVIAAYVRDITDHDKMIDEIKQRDRLLNTVNDTANVLLASASDENFEESLASGIGLMGHSVNVDRVYIMKNEVLAGERYFSYNFEWLNDVGKQSRHVTLGDKYPYSIDRDWEAKFENGECLNGPVRYFPHVMREFFERLDIRSTLVIPVFIQEEFWGLVSFSDCQKERYFSEDEVKILRSGALLMGNAMERRAQTEKLREAHEHTTLILDAMPFMCNLWDRDLNMFGCNEEITRLFDLEDKKEYEDNFTAFSPVYQPDGQLSIEKAGAAIREAFDKGKCVMEWMHQKRDGTPIPAEITLVRVAHDDDYVVCAYMRDLREQKQMMAEIGRRDVMLNKVNNAATILLQTESEQFENNLKLCMGMMAEAVNADRVCIWRNHTRCEQLYCSEIHEWQGGALPRYGTELKTNFLYKRDLPGWKETLSEGKCINSIVREMSKKEQEQLVPRGVKSMFAAPVFVQDEFWGLVCFDNCHEEKIFSESEEAALRSGSMLLANALLRNEMMKTLKTSAADLEEALELAQDANQAKSDFLAKMSHEMRTPLNAIIGLSELCIGDETLNEEALANAEKINNAGATLLSTVNDILDISKIEANKLELIPTAYDMPSLLNDTITQSIMHIGDKPITLILDLDPNLPTQLYGDELRIKQILNNLLSNAFKYTRAGTVELGVRAEKKEEKVWLSAWVRDSGIGIKPENLEKLFEDYTQLDTKANRRIMGTGLGLTITKKLVEVMSGSINVESEYGKGSTFTVRLLQKHVTDSVIGPEVVDSLKKFRYSDAKRRKASKKKAISMPYAHVLIVDDIATNLDVAKGLMKPYNMKIDCLMSGQEAIDAIKAEKTRYSAIFMDQMMPGMDGIEATKRIRAIGTDYAKNIPVIALTANAIVGNEEMFINEGFQAFISKPIEITKLDAVLREWVRDKDLEAHLSGGKEGENTSVVLAYAADIDGLDAVKGMERFSWDEDTYVNILRSYKSNTIPLLEKIKDVKKDELDSYAIVVHGIKGSSRGIGANEIGDLAEALEKAAKAGDIDYVTDGNKPFLKVAKKLIADLDGMLSMIDNTKQKPKMDKPDATALNRLMEACKEYDMDGVDTAIAEIKSFSYVNDNGLTEWLNENVEQMNFTQIVERLMVYQ